VTSPRQAPQAQQQPQTQQMPMPQVPQTQPQAPQSPSNIDIVSPESRMKYIGLFQSFGPVNNILNGKAKHFIVSQIDEFYNNR
jgi:hypothetical protein